MSKISRDKKAKMKKLDGVQSTGSKRAEDVSRSPNEQNAQKTGR